MLPKAPRFTSQWDDKGRRRFDTFHDPSMVSSAKHHSMCSHTQVPRKAPIVVPDHPSALRAHISATSGTPRRDQTTISDYDPSKYAPSGLNTSRQASPARHESPSCNVEPLKDRWVSEHQAKYTRPVPGNPVPVSLPTEVVPQSPVANKVDKSEDTDALHWQYQVKQAAIQTDPPFHSYYAVKTKNTLPASTYARSYHARRGSANARKGVKPLIPKHIDVEDSTAINVSNAAAGTLVVRDGSPHRQAHGVENGSSAVQTARRGRTATAESRRRSVHHHQQQQQQQQQQRAQSTDGRRRDAAVTASASHRPTRYVTQPRSASAKPVTADICEHGKVSHERRCVTCGHQSMAALPSDEVNVQGRSKVAIHGLAPRRVDPHVNVDCPSLQLDTQTQTEIPAPAPEKDLAASGMFMCSRCQAIQRSSNPRVEPLCVRCGEVCFPLYVNCEASAEYQRKMREIERRDMLLAEQWANRKPSLGGKRMLTPRHRGPTVADCITMFA